MASRCDKKNQRRGLICAGMIVAVAITSVVRIVAKVVKIITIEAVGVGISRESREVAEILIKGDWSRQSRMK